MKHPFTKFSLRKKKPNLKTAPKTSRGMSFGQSVFLIVLAGTGLLAASGWYWYQNVLTDPTRIMSDMLDKSLQTTSVYRSVELNGERDSAKQSVYLTFSPNTAANSLTERKESTAAGSSTLKYETIGTPNADYVRYSSIDISTPGTKQQNFSNVLDVWGKREPGPQAEQPVSFLNEALFVAVPFGNLNADQRQALKKEIERVELYEVTQTNSEFVNGRPVMSYTVNISPQALVQVLAKYVELTGVGNGAELNPALYEGASKAQIIIQADMLSRHIRQIEFIGSGRVETYGGYNIEQKIDLPEETIEIDELQRRLSEIEQS